jgi:putative flippase GtrA
MPLFLQFIRFASAGATGTAVHYAFLLILVHFSLAQPVTASILGSFCGALINYLLSHHWVFKSNRGHRETFTRFFIISAIGLALNAALMYVLVAMSGIHYLPSQLVATGIVLLWNFLGNRFWAFAGHNEQSR